MIEGVERIPLKVFSDERGWFCELRRESTLPKRMVQTNVSFSRAGVVRVEGWWEDAGKHWQHLAEIGRLVEETGANG